MPKIQFILLSGNNGVVEDKQTQEKKYKIGLEHPPRPSKNFIPESYKKLDSYTNNDLRKATIKKCMPFLDALTSGYIIPFFQDYLITMDYVEKKWNVQSPFTNPCPHSSVQLPKGYVSDFLRDKEIPIGLFENKWVIKTPPGYSCLFIHPMNTPKINFEIISGVVDTDTYEDIILFPYYFKRYDSEDKKAVQMHIKLGNPMVQIIPFKRESWSSSSVVKVEDRVGRWRKKWAGHLFDGYKKFYRHKKHYD